MKFLCDNCKAKYQIADEKVAGKTVRMKCRKCGHQIEVRAAVTESSVTGLPPVPPVPQKSLATSLSATKPRAPAPHKEVGGGSGALAGAFQRTVQDAPSNAPYPGAQEAPLDLSVSNEWYVAINGVPVGPVRISELRRKAASGAVTEDSLCWQEGLEEWRPVRSVPELASLVREAAQGNRPSFIAPPPEPSAPARPAAPPKPPQRPLRPSDPVRTAGPPLGPSHRSNVVPLRPAASLDGDVVTAPLGSAASALAPSLTPSPSPSFAPAPLLAPMPTPAPTPVVDPFAVPSAPALPATASVMPPAPLGYPPPSEMGGKRGVPLWFWPILLIALGFGGSVAFLVFRPQPTPQPVVIQMPATQQPPQDKGDVPPPPPPTIDSAPSATPGAPSKPGPVAAKGPATTPTEKRPGIDLGNLLPGQGGPSVGPGSTPGSSGGGLDQAAVEKVVANHRPGVKRTCWERGGADQKSSVNVTVTASVAPNGAVSSTSSSGDDPVVGKCIENQVKMWQFPAPGEPKTLQLPFKFVRQ